MVLIQTCLLNYCCGKSEAAEETQGAWGKAGRLSFIIAGRPSGIISQRLSTQQG